MNAANSQCLVSDGVWSGSVRLVCTFAVAQLGLHAWFAASTKDPRMWMPHAVAWLLDMFLLIVLTTVLWRIGRTLCRCGFPRRLWTFGENASVFMAGMLLASYPGLLAEFLAFPTNVFRADAASGWFFVSEYLGWTGLWPLLVSVATVTLASRVPLRSVLAQEAVGRCRADHFALVSDVNGSCAAAVGLFRTGLDERLVDGRQARCPVPIKADENLPAR